MKDFNNKKAFITGGSQGIGLGTTKLLAQKGDNVAILSLLFSKINLGSSDTT